MYKIYTIYISKEIKMCLCPLKLNYLPSVHMKASGIEADRGKIHLVLLLAF